jgi:hypothetical protein
MSILKTNYQKSDNNGQIEENDNDKNVKFVSIPLENEAEQTSSTPKLRSILRKQVGKKVSTNKSSNVQQITILLNENDNNKEKDSDYTGDEDDGENNATNITIEKESQINEQHYHHFLRQQQKDQFFQKFSLTSSNDLLEIEKPRTEKKDFTVNDQSSNRTTCVTFANEQPAIIHRSSSTPSFGEFNIELHPSVTYINMKEDLPTITTTTTAINSDFRPVYVSPLKYRPLLGLTANDSRLLLEKRVSLLGKPVVFHPIQKRSLSYRRKQLLIYNFLERANGYKAIIYHTFV